MKKRKCKYMLAAAFIVIIMNFSYAIPLSVHASSAVPERRVRVGFFAFDGFHMIDKNGRKSGYGYDYLQYLARYANFRYDYVGYDKSWNEMQDMLENGEIDILSSAQKTPEREERFDFTDQPVGSSAAILTVKAGNERYMVEDYARLNGIRVGLLEGNSRNGDLEQFAGEQGFMYQPVYFENTEELVEALQKGEVIDAALTSNIRKIRNEWIIASFDGSPFYIMVKKGNEELLDEINMAMGKLQVDYSNLASDLHKKYYSAGHSGEIVYTAEERVYIKKRQEADDAVRVTINSGREPVSFFVDGEGAGIIPELAREVFRRTGLPYEFIATPPAQDARELLARGDAEVRFDGTADFDEAERSGLRVTDPYLRLTISSVTLKDFNGTPKRVAVIKNSDVVEEYAEKIYDEAGITRYDSARECLDAVLSGKQDAAFFQTYIAQKLVNDDIRNRLKEQLVPGHEMAFALGIRRDDAALFSILNKAVLSLDEEEINRIVREQTVGLARDPSLLAYLYDHPVIWSFWLAAAAGFIIILILYIFRRKNLKLERERAKEFERFISYVCRANNNVMEVDPQQRLCWLYQVAEGSILCEERSYKNVKPLLYDIHPADKENVGGLTGEEAVRRLIETGEEIYFECRVTSEEWAGGYRWMAYTLQGVPANEEKPGRMMIFIKDIDSVKREEEEKRRALQDALEAARQSGEARGAFLSRMSHEIRTPLNAVIGYLSIACANLNNTVKVEECLKKSDIAAKQLLRIVNDVLDISAIESGKMKIVHEPFNLRKLVSDVTAIFHTQAAGKGIKFRVKLNDLTEENLVGDQFRLSQILVNLLSNALKFTPVGGQVSLAIQQKGVVNQSVFLQLTVSDTGIGMTEDFKKRLFRPFEQQDAFTAQKFGGTGLGLSITKNLVQMMNGTIDVESEEGQGTRFFVNLSFDIEKAKTNTDEFIDFSRLRVLVLYDRNGDYRYIQTLLTRFGIEFTTTFGPDEAVKRIAEDKEQGRQFNLCLIDWDLSGLKAPEAVKRILAAAAPHRPVLLASACKVPELTAENNLIDDIVLKPVFQTTLFEALWHVCRHHLQKGRRSKYGLACLKGARIILAEDNELNMEIATEILTGFGLLIDSAQNGLEAAELFERSQDGDYQAILMDIQMPVLNGYAAAARIRAGKHPQASSIPIIALSADAFSEDINRAMAAGMNGHVSKPVDFELLCNILSDFISEERG